MTMEILTRAAGRLGSYNSGARTVELVFASEEPCRRHSWDGAYDEVLTINRDAIDATRLDSMALLDSHDAYSGLDSRLGSIVPGSLRIEGKTAVVTAKISRNPKGEALARDLEDGHVMAVSVGYRIDKSEKTQAPAGGTAVIRATRWTPFEISIVSVPADPNAATRSELERNDDMRKRYYTSPPTPEQLREREEEERERQEFQAQKRSIAEAREYTSKLLNVSKVPEEVRERMSAFLRRGITYGEIHSELVRILAEIDERTPTCAVSSMNDYLNPMSGQRSFADAAADALQSRINPRHQPKDDARELVGLTIPEIARRCIEANGNHTHGLSPSALVTRALHTTSDFPHIMSNLANKTLQDEFQQVPAALKAVARRSSARDFKMKTHVKLSSAPDLEHVTETGEYKRGTMFEDQESYRIDTFGKIFGISRQALINDDLGAFASASAKMGQAAAVFEAKFLVNLLTSNPIMSDSKALFHVDHKNLAAAGTALDEASLSAARLSFRRQVGLAGDLVNLSPRFLIVGAELETTAEKLLATINAAKTSDVNPFSGKLELVVEPRLIGKAWYLAADPGTCEGLEYAYLDGLDGPEFETRAGFDVDGVEFKVRLDFGAAFLEHRGWYKNPGLAE